MTGLQATPDGDAALAERAYRAATEAYLAAPHGWEEGVFAALAELLELLARESEGTESCAVLISPSIETLGARSALVERFARLLAPGAEVAALPRPDIVAEAVGQSVLELIAAYVADGRATRLPEALATVTLLVLTPFVGSDAAERLAAAADDRRR